MRCSVYEILHEISVYSVAFEVVLVGRLKCRLRLGKRSILGIFMSQLD
jgi:hypothetical protein